MCSLKYSWLINDLNVNKLYITFFLPSVSFPLQGKLPTGQFFPPASERMAVITADPYKEEEGSDFDKAPQQLAGFEETPVHASDTMYCELFLYSYHTSSLKKSICHHLCICLLILFACFVFLVLYIQPRTMENWLLARWVTLRRFSFLICV